MSIKQIAGFIGGVVVIASVAALAAAPANAGPGVNPPKWVSIAYSPATGASGWANEMYSVEEAADGAYYHCINNGGTDCSVVAASEGGCAVLVRRDGPGAGWGVGSGPSRRDAFDAAYRDYLDRTVGYSHTYDAVNECAFNPHW